MIKSAFNKWSSWSLSGKAIFISYNGMRFDEEIFKEDNLLEPIRSIFD